MTNESKVVRMDDHKWWYPLSRNSVQPIRQFGYELYHCPQHQVPLRRTVVEAGISELHLTRKPHWIDTGRVKVCFGEIALMLQKDVKQIVSQVMWSYTIQCGLIVEAFSRFHAFKITHVDNSKSGMGPTKWRIICFALGSSVNKILNPWWSE